ISGGLFVERCGSFTFSFLFCLGMVVAAGLLVGFGVKDEFLPARRERDGRHGAAGTGSLQVATRRVRLDGEMVRLFVIVFCLTLGVALLVPILTFYGRDVLGLRPEQFALTLALPGVVTAVALVPLGSWV